MTWKEKADVIFNQVHDSLQTVVDALNKGQRQKLLKDETVKKLFERYGVNTDAAD